MHPDLQPDLFLRVYQQQERELTQRLLRRLAARSRGTGRRHPARRWH
jgi:hypothetical protein